MTTIDLAQSRQPAISGIMFIDSAIQDPQLLESNARSGIRVVRLDAARDGVEQIGEILSGYSELDSVQIVSHGAAGQLLLGSALLSASTLANHQDALKKWGGSLKESGDLLLYGCDVAAGDEGRFFLHALAQATGADVAGSTDTTGSSALGANWVLERSSGSIEAASALSLPAMQDYGHTLALVNNGNPGIIRFDTGSNVTLRNVSELGAGEVVELYDILGKGLDVHAQSSNGGSISIVNANGTSAPGVPPTDDRLSVNGSQLSPVSYVDLRANSGVFDLISLKLGSSSLSGNQTGTVIFTVYALDANYEPTGSGESLEGLQTNEYALLDLGAMDQFKGIYGVRIVNPLGLDEVGIDDVVVTNGRMADTEAPNLQISSSAAALKIGETATITFTFSEAPRGLIEADVTATNGTFSGLKVTDDPRVYTGVFTPTAGMDEGSGWVSIASASYTDLAGNPGGGATLPAIAIDTQAPTTFTARITFSADSGTSGSDLVTNVAAQAIIGVLASVHTFGDTVEVRLDDGASWTTASSIAGIYSWWLDGQTLIAGPNQQVQMRVSDGFGNHGAVTGFAYTLDQSPPTLQITSSQTTLNSAETALISFTFSEAPVDFTLNDVTTTGGTLANFTATANPLVYTAVFTPTAGVASGTGSLLVAAGTYIDAAGNSGIGAAAPAITYATVWPGVAISSDKDILHSGETAIITFRFSSAPAGFNANDATASGGTLSEFNATANPLVYTAVFTPSAGQTDGMGMVSVADDTFTDGSNNSGVGATLQLRIDTVAPTLFITSDTAALNAGATALITFTFSEEPAGLSLDDIGVNNGELSNLVKTSNPLVYTAVLTPTANLAAGIAIISVPWYTDKVGNPGIDAYSPTIAIDTLAPTITGAGVAFSQDTGASGDLVTNAAAQHMAGALTGNLAAGDVVEVSLDHGATWQTARSAAGSLTWSLADQTLSMDPAQHVQVRVSDGFGNHGAVSSYAYTLDQSAPKVQITSSKTTLNSVGVALITFTFDEAPQSFTASRVATTGGTLLGFAVTANPLVYTAHFIPTAGQAAGVGSVSVAYGAYFDTADNLGVEGSMLPIGIDTVAPTLGISTNTTDLKAGETALITFTFSEAPVSFSLGDIDFSNGQLSDLVKTANPATYTAVLTPTAHLAAGIAVISVDFYADLAGNPGSVASSRPIAIDTLAPTTAAASIAFSDDNGVSDTDLITNAATQTISGTLDAPLAAGDWVEVLLNAGATWIKALSTGTAQWELTPQVLTGSGKLQVRVRDDAGNTGPVFARDYVLDLAPPTVTIRSNTASTLGPGQSAQLIFTLSEPGVLTPDDILVTAGVLSNFSGSGTTYTATLTPPANSSKPLTVSVAGNLFSDAAGNASAAAVPLVLSVNTVVPTPQPEPQPQPQPTTVDGTSILTAPGPGGSTIIHIPVVTSSRTDAPGTPTPLADIPLLTSSSGHTLLLASVPTGVGLHAEGLVRSTTGPTGLAELIARIKQVAGDDAGLIEAAQAFHAGLPSSAALTVQIIKPTAGAGFHPDIPLVITGSSNAADGRQAVILDARSLPSGSTIQVDHVDFLTVVGAVRIIGGAGQNTAVGNGAAQYLLLGPDDDTIHGGGGNDTVGAKGGDQHLHGDAGDDIVFGGAGNDLLSGGTGSDRLNGGTGFDVAIQEGSRTDYTVTLDAAGIKLTHIASGVTDWLVDVEQVRFETGPTLTVAHSAAEEAAAFLFQKWMGRELTQAEGAVIQTLEDLSALQVADLFAQVFPQQAGGKAAQQLIEGMADAGAVRMDAERKTAFVGDAGDNTIAPTLGLAWSVDGGAGVDTLGFPALLKQTHIEANGAGFTLQRMTDGATLELSNVERVAFSDTHLALDLDGHAGEAAKLLGALGGLALLANKPLVGEVIRALDAGITSQSLAALGLKVLGAQTPLEVTQLLWTHIVGSAATPAQLQPFVDLLAQGMTGAELAVLTSSLELNAVRIDLVGLAGNGIEFT